MTYNNENVEQEESKRDVKSWVKKHKVKIVAGVTVVGGLCLMKMVYREGYRQGAIDGTFAAEVTEAIEEAVGE